MEIVILFIGSGLCLTAAYLYFALKSSPYIYVTPQSLATSPIPQKKVTNFFIGHPTAFQVIFHLMFLSFPIAVLFTAFPGMNAYAQAARLETIVILFYIWPFLMWRIHWEFVDYSMKFGISSRTVAVDDSIPFAKQKVIVWIVMVVVGVLALIIKTIDHSTILSSLRFLGLLGAVFIPIRESLAIIRGKEQQELERNC